MARANPEDYNLISVERVAAVLRALEGPSAQSLEQVAKRAGLSDSTALRYLSSLSRQDLVEREDQTGDYVLGMHLLQLGRAAIAQRKIEVIARPVLEALLEEFQETVNLGGRHGDGVILLEVLQSPRSLRKGVTIRGGVDSWHSTSIGKAILAALPRPEAMEILARQNLVAYTPTTLTTLEGLMGDLDAIAARGYAIDDEESDEGLRCVGAAIRDHRGNVSFSISISGPKSRMPFSRIQEIGERLCSVSLELSTSIGSAS